MKAFHLAIRAVAIILFSGCNRDPDPESGLNGEISCSGQSYLVTHRGLLSLHNLNPGDVVAYNNIDESLHTISTLAQGIIDSKIPNSSVINKESLDFDRITNVEINGNLTVAEKATIGAEVETNFKRAISLGFKDLKYEEIPRVFEQMEKDTALKEYMTARNYHEESTKNSHLTYFVVDKVYSCKEVYLVDSLNRRINIGAEIPVKTVKGIVKVRIDNSCSSILATSSDNSFKILYGLKPFKLSKTYWIFTPVTHQVFSPKEK